MANNLSAILAGEAYLRYFVKNDEAKQGNKEAADDVNRTHAQMRRSDEAYLRWRVGLFQRRFQEERRQENAYTSWRVGMVQRRAQEEAKAEQQEFKQQERKRTWIEGMNRGLQGFLTKQREDARKQVARDQRDEENAWHQRIRINSAVLEHEQKNLDKERQSKERHRGWVEGMNRGLQGFLSQQREEARKQAARDQRDAENAQHQKIRINSAVLEHEQKTLQQEQKAKDKHRGWIEGMNRGLQGFLSQQRENASKLVAREQRDAENAQHQRIRINSAVLENDQRIQQRKEDLAHAEYIRQVKFNSKILELQTAKDKKSEDQAYAEYIKLVKFNSRVLELRQQAQKREEKQQRDHDTEMQRLREQQQQVQERSTDAFYDRQERKRKARVRQEQRERRKEIAETQRIEQAERDKLTGLRDVAVAGSYFGQRMSQLGSRGIQGVMNSVREYGDVESSLLSMRLFLKDKTQNIDADLGRIEKSAHRIGVATEYDAAEIAAMQERLAQGHLNGQQVERSSMPVTNVASAFSNSINGKVVPALAARTVLETVNAQEMGLDAIPDVADKMAQAARLADLSLQGLGDSLRYAGGTLKEAGMDFDTILSLLVYLDKRGQKGEQGGTTLRGIVASILDPPKESQQAFRDNRIELQKRGQLDFMRLIRQFENRLGNVSQTEAATVITKMFPNRQMTGMELLVGGSAEIELIRQKIAAARGKGEALAANKRQGVAFSLDMVGSAAQTAKSSAGKTVSDEVSWGAKQLAGGLEYLGQTFEKYPALGKTVGLLSLGLGVFGRTVGAVAEGMGGVAGLLLMKGTMNALGLSVGGIFRSLMTGLKSVASLGVSGTWSLVTMGVKGAAAVAMMGVKVTASLAWVALRFAGWPALVASALVGVGYAIDKFFNNGALTKSILAGLDALKAQLNGRWDRSDTWKNAEDDPKTALTNEKAAAALKAKSTYVRDNMGRVIGIRDPGGQYRARDFTREQRQRGAFTPVEEMAGTSDADMRFFGDPARAAEVKSKSTRETWAPTLRNLNRIGGNYLDRFGRTAKGLWDKGEEFVKQAREQIATNAERSPTNPKNAKAWREFLKENPLIPGFEKEGQEARAKGWEEYLKSYRSRALPETPARAALENLGDYDARSSKGIGYILDLFNPQKENRDEEKKVQEDIREAAQATAAALEKNVLLPVRIGKGK